MAKHRGSPAATSGSHLGSTRSSFRVSAVSASILTTDSWQILYQLNCPQIPDPQKPCEIINVCCFKPLQFEGVLWHSNRQLTQQSRFFKFSRILFFFFCKSMCPNLEVQSIWSQEDLLALFTGWESLNLNHYQNQKSTQLKSVWHPWRIHYYHPGHWKLLFPRCSKPTS